MKTIDLLICVLNIIYFRGGENISYFMDIISFVDQSGKRYNSDPLIGINVNIKDYGFDNKSSWRSNTKYGVHDGYKTHLDIKNQVIYIVPG